MRYSMINSFLLLLILSNLVAAQEAEDERHWWDLASSIDSLADSIGSLVGSIPEKLFDYFIYLINAPLLPLLGIVKSLLTAEVSIDLFFQLWSVVRYIISFFYIFLFLYAGFVFLTSNANPIKRVHAKEMLKDTLLMIVLVQGSFYIYESVICLGSMLSNGILSMIDPQFFLLTVDNFSNVALEFVFAFAYGMTLFLTSMMLVIRYILVSVGVALFPIGLFFYFIPPLKGYGRLIINALGICIFITFFDLLIILACSMIVTTTLLANFKILVMICCFSTINYTLYLAIKFALSRSSASDLKSDLGQAVKHIAMAAA